MFTARRSDQLVRVGFVLALSVLVANAVLTFRDVRTVHASGRWIAHTRIVLHDLQGALSLLKDAETAQRGYLLTDRLAYLAPYHEARQELDPALGRLEALTADNPSRQASVRAFARCAGELMEELDRQLVARRDEGRETALAALLTDRAKTLMDDARQLVLAMEDEETRLLEARSTAYDTSIERTVASSVITTGVAIALLLAVVSLARLHPARESAAEPPPAPTRPRRPRRSTSTRNQAESPLAVLVIIALSILALCAVLVIVSRL